MTQVDSTISRFVKPDMVSAMINHATLNALLGIDWEHHGILEKLRELIDREVPLDDLLVGMVLSESEFVGFAFWADEPDLVDTAKTFLRGQQPYDKVIKDGWWKRAWAWLQDFDVESEEKSAAGKRIPIAEIHSPHVPGCVGTFATTRSGALDVSIKAFGLGYQRIKRVDIQDTYEVPSTCRALTTGVKFVVHVWRHRFNGKRRALVQMIDIDGSVIDEPLPRSYSHLCGQDYQTGAAHVHSELI
jgi:hypothetical protein